MRLFLGTDLFLHVYIDIFIIILIIQQADIEDTVRYSFSVRLLSVRLSICFSNFHLLLQTYWTNFNQLSYKDFLGMFKLSFPRGDNWENKLICFKFLLLKTTGPTQTSVALSILGELDSSLFKLRATPCFEGEQITKYWKYIYWQKSYTEPLGQFQQKMAQSILGE